MKTKSESLFEEFLATNNLPFEKIEEDTTSRPDYRVSIGGSDIIFEIKELTEDENFGVVKDPAYPHIKSSSRTTGDHIRRKIESSKKQLQFGAKQGIPSIHFLIYNNIDPVFQDFGTEPMDFTAAMYGACTILINRESRTASDWFNGKDRMLQQSKNTSFSAPQGEAVGFDLLQIVALQVVKDHRLRAIDLALRPLGALSVTCGFLFAAFVDLKVTFSVLRAS